jgi:hypothetical protein
MSSDYFLGSTTPRDVSSIDFDNVQSHSPIQMETIIDSTVISRDNRDVMVSSRNQKMDDLAEDTGADLGTAGDVVVGRHLYPIKTIYLCI